MTEQAKATPEPIGYGYGPELTHGTYMTLSRTKAGRFDVPVFAEPPAVPAETVDPTNHHNALKCPYCNPKGLQFADQPQPQPMPDRFAMAAALARKLCQLFDNGGESQRSVRARHASAIFQLLEDDTPGHRSHHQRADIDPVGYLNTAETSALSRPARGTQS